MAETPAPGTPLTPELKNALKAFKKRLKLARLDDESRLGGRYTSSGGQSGIIGIFPPAAVPGVGLGGTCPPGQAAQQWWRHLRTGPAERVGRAAPPPSSRRGSRELGATVLWTASGDQGRARRFNGARTALACHDPRPLLATACRSPRPA